MKNVIAYIGITIVVVISIVSIVIFTLGFNEWFNATQQVQHIIY